MTKLIQYKNASKVKLKNKSIQIIKHEGSALVTIKHLNKDMCDTLQSGGLTYFGGAFTDRGIHILEIKLHKKSLEALYIAIGDALNRSVI